MGVCTDPGQKRELLTGLLDLYTSQLLIDVTLIAEDQSFPCHRNVLAASSPYFRAMFTSNVKETTQSEVILYEVDAEALGTILHFMYTGELHLHHDNVQNVFTAASLLEMAGVRKLCTDYMRSHLHHDNCVGVYQLGSFHSCLALREAGRRYIVDHFLEVSEMEDICLLNYDDLVLVIADDELNVESEEVVWKAVVRWLEFSVEVRKRHLPQLMRLVRLPLLSEEVIEEQIMTNSLVESSSYCQGLIAMARLYTATKVSDDPLSRGAMGEIDGFDLNVRPRLGMFATEMLVFAGGSQEKYIRALTCYDPRTKKNFYAIQPHVSFDFKYRIDLHRSVSTDSNEIYLLGGIFYEDHHFEEAGPALREVKVFDPHRKSWIAKAPMIKPRCAHRALYLHGQIYVMGGKATYPMGEPLDSMEVYDIKRDTWSYLATMPLKLYHHSAVVLDGDSGNQASSSTKPLDHGKIMVIGGMTADNQVTNAFLEYDIATDFWTNVTPCMQVPRAEFGATVAQNKVFVIGGTNGNVKLCSVEVFNLSTRKWQFGVDFPEDRKSMVTVTFDDCVYVCGGVRTLISRLNRAPRMVETRDLWKYDPSTGFWNREVKLVQYANVHACVVAKMNTRHLVESEFVSSG